MATFTNFPAAITNGRRLRTVYETKIRLRSKPCITSARLRQSGAARGAVEEHPSFSFPLPNNPHYEPVLCRRFNRSHSNCPADHAAGDLHLLSGELARFLLARIVQAIHSSVGAISQNILAAALDAHDRAFLR